MARPKKLKSIKSSIFKRSLSLAQLTVNTAANVASHGIKNVFADEDLKNRNWSKLLKKQADHLARELGELKGSLMKAGQMLSMYGEHFLPKEANDFLKTLQSDSPFLEWPAIEKIINSNFSPEQLSQLDITQTPIGSASMGQVHQAKIKATGEKIVLKIQYPGVENAIDSDLKALKLFLNLMKLLPQGLNMEPVFNEIKKMLLHELDYRAEAQSTITYSDLLKGDSRFIVPRIYKNFCTDKIIASSYEEGLKVDSPEVLNLPQNRRNQIALNFLDLYFKEIFQWGFVQTDPHLGNYRVRLGKDGSDQLILFDFGATLEYLPEFLTHYRQMIRASVENNIKALEQSALELKFLDKGDSAALKKHFKEFCLLTVEPFLEPTDPRAQGQINTEGEYDWKNTDLPQRVTKKAFEMIKEFHVRTPPQEVLFLDRKTGGVFIFLSVLGAKINGLQVLKKYYLT